MNILVSITKNFAGCGFYRLFQPHLHLAKNYKVKVTLNSGLWKNEKEKMSDDEIKSFDLIVWHKGFFEIDDIKRAKELGVPTVVDFDDHWVLNPEHTLAPAYAKDNTSVKLHKLLITADYITCTTDILADEIYQHNKNVVVLPNAMDMSHEGCKERRKEEKEYCFGYIGGHFHINDVRLLRGLAFRLKEDCQNYKMRLFGYDDSFPYKEYANILSNFNTAPIEVFAGLPIFQYHQFYNLMDCSLVPLVDNRFNSYKSELKMIEAGFFKKAVIVSNVHPYSTLINNSNCLKVDSPSDWYKHCKRLINNPEVGKELGNALYDSVQQFSIERVNQSRYKFYQDVHEKHDHNSPVRVSGMEEFQ